MVGRQQPVEEGFDFVERWCSCGDGGIDEPRYVAQEIGNPIRLGRWVDAVTPRQVVCRQFGQVRAELQGECPVLVTRSDEQPLEASELKGATVRSCWPFSRPLYYCQEPSGRHRHLLQQMNQGDDSDPGGETHKPDLDRNGAVLSGGQTEHRAKANGPQQCAEYRSFCHARRLSSAVACSSAALADACCSTVIGCSENRAIW